VNQELQVFNFGALPVNIVDRNNEPWFIMNDICNILGYANPRDALARHCKEKGVAKCDTLTSGGRQEVTIINEANLYRLITKSKKPNAEKFEDWVMDDVLPAIRRHGVYRIPEQTQDVLPLLKAAVTQIENLKAENEALLPDAAYTRAVLKSDSLKPLKVTAAQLQISAIALNRFLHYKQIIYREGTRWYPYASWNDCGLFGIDTFAYQSKSTGENKSRELLKTTEKGRRFIIELYRFKDEKPAAIYKRLFKEA
jgi:prophage antirepressor-like protein